MAALSLGVVMNGVTGRMGYRQHLVRSFLAIRDQGGVELRDGTRVQLEPVLVGRNEDKLREIAHRHGLDTWTTDLDAALTDQNNQIYFDAQLTSVREKSVVRAIDAGKHVYTENRSPRPSRALSTSPAELATPASRTASSTTSCSYPGWSSCGG